MRRKMDKLKRPAGIITLSALGAVLLTGISGNPENITAFFSETAQSQIAQAGFFFTLAAWVHSSRVKKEITANFERLTFAINQVAEAFRQDLNKHGEELDSLSTRVSLIENKVQQDNN